MNFGQAVYFADGLGVEHAALVFAVLDADTVDLMYLPKANDPRLFSADFETAEKVILQPANQEAVKELLTKFQSAVQQ